MRHVAIAGCATLAFLGVISQPALAQQNWHESPLVKLHNNVSLAGGTTYQHYREHSNGNTIDKETGWLPNVKASASYMSSVQHYFLSAGVRYSWGHTSYQSANGNTHTDNKILSVNGKIGKGFQIDRRLMVTPFVTYGHRYWHRGLTGTATARGYTEKYNMNYAGAGVMADYQVMPRLILSAQAMGGATFDNTMTTSTYPYTFDLGSKPLAKAALKADYRVHGNWHVFGTVHYTYFEFGHSNKHPIGSGLNVSEPNSTTNNASIDLGVRYTF